MTLATVRLSLFQFFLLLILCHGESWAFSLVGNLFSVHKLGRNGLTSKPRPSLTFNSELRDVGRPNRLNFVESFYDEGAIYKL